MNANPSEEQVIDLTVYYQILVKHKWLIVLCMTIGVTLAVWINVQMAPIYEATTTLAMNNRQLRSPVTGEALAYEDIISQTLAFQTHSKLINSRPVLEAVIRELKLDQMDPLKQVETRTFDQLVFIIKSNFDRLTGNVPETVDDKARLSALVKNLQGKIAIKDIRNTLLLTISATDNEPAMAQNIANTLAKAYIQYDIASRLKSSQNTFGWMNDQIYEMKKKLDDAEQEFLAFKQSEKLFSLEGRQGQLTQKINEFNESYVQTKNRRMELEVKLRELQRTLDSSGKIQHVRALVDNPLINELYKQLVEAEVEFSKLANVYKPKHPMMVQLSTQIEKTSKKLKDELNKEVANINSEKTLLEVREKSLQNAVTDFEDDAMSVNKIEMKYTILERNVDTYRKLYDALLSKSKQSNIANNSETSSDLRIAEEAGQPGDPIRPRKKLNFLLGLVLGTMSGVGLAFMLNYMDRTIRTDEDVRIYLGLPVLSLIPMAEKGKILNAGIGD